MSQQYPHAMAEAALKWRDLAERRRAHFVELYETGRWKHYYSDQAFLDGLREANTIADRWAQIAPRASDAIVVPPAAQVAQLSV